MSARSGTHRLGPEDATLSVRTKRSGAAAKAGHDLLIEVSSWNATLVIGEASAATSVELGADPTSLRVIKGSGGRQALTDEDKASIQQTIADEVLDGRGIGFRSTGAKPSSDGSRITVEGELTIGDRTAPIAFDLEIGGGGTLNARTTLKQSDWGIKPYSTLFGALKVEDEIEVVLDGHL